FRSVLSKWTHSRCCGAPANLHSFVPWSGDQSVPHRLLTSKFAGATRRLGLLPCRPLGRLFIETPSLHLPEYALPLHFLLQDAKSLIDMTKTCNCVSPSAVQCARNFELGYDKSRHALIRARAPQSSTRDGTRGIASNDE